MITEAYRILTIEHVQGLLCLYCNHWSPNEHDIAHHYCGYCHQFLDDVPMLAHVSLTTSTTRQGKRI